VDADCFKVCTHYNLHNLFMQPDHFKFHGYAFSFPKGPSANTDIIGGVIPAVLVVFVVTIMVCVAAFVAVRRHKHTEKLIYSG